MKILSKASHSDITYLMQGYNYQHIHAKLMKLLPGNLADYFAMIDAGQSGSKWYTNSDDEFICFSNASEDEKDLIAIQISKLNSEISAILKADKELSPISDHILQIPNEGCIFFSKDNGRLKVVITQWGCIPYRQGRNANVMDTMLKRATKDNSRVAVKISYEDGELASNENFIFEYNSVVKDFDTDAQGVKDFGIFKNGSHITISNHNGASISFIVDGEQESDIYPVIFKRLTDVNIKVINQLGHNVSDYPININVSDFSSSFTTDYNGEVFMKDVPHGNNPFTITSTDGHSQSFTLEKSDNNFIFKIVEDIRYGSTIRTVNENGTIVPNYPITVKIDDVDKELLTDDNGVVDLSPIAPNTSFNVTDGKNKFNNIDFTISKENDLFDFTVMPPAEKLVKITVIDEKNQIIPSNPIEVKTKKDKFDKLTDEKGEIFLPFSAFTDKERFKASIKLPNNDKFVSAKTRFKKENLEYVFKIRPKRNFWWFLLLLLPLLLFINLHRDVEIQTINNAGMPAPNVPVNMQYTSSYLLKDGSFFKKENYNNTSITDSSGKAVFKDVGFSIYSLVFKARSKAIFSITSDCHEIKNNHRCFHFMFNPVKLYIVDRLINIDMFVMDTNKKPIPSSMVYFKTIVDGEIVIDSVMTGPDGHAEIRKLSNCGLYDTLRGSHSNYSDKIYANKRVKTPDTIILDPKIGEKFFRTLDEYDSTLLPDVDLSIFVDGVLTNAKSDNNGQFTVRAPYSAQISIIAQKSGFATNNKIKNEFSFYMNSTQKERDIYMELPDCTTQIENHQKSIHTLREVNLKKKSGQFLFEYNTQTIPDKIVIYDGRIKDNNKKVIFDFYGGTNGLKSTKVNFSSQIITVEIIGGDSGTAWDYKINCP